MLPISVTARTALLAQQEPVAPCLQQLSACSAFILDRCVPRVMDGDDGDGAAENGILDSDSVSFDGAVESPAAQGLRHFHGNRRARLRIEREPAFVPILLGRRRHGFPVTGRRPLQPRSAAACRRRRTALLPVLIEGESLA